MVNRRRAPHSRTAGSSTHRSTLWLPVIAAACAATGPSDTDLTIVGPVNAMFPGQTAVAVIAQDSVVLANAAATWVSRDTTIVGIAEPGVLVARDTGVTVVLAEVDSLRDSMTVRVIPPPDGRIAFVAAPRPLVLPDSFRLWEMNPDGSGLEELGRANIGPPAFSPDGSALAVSDGSPPRIFILSSSDYTVLSEPTLGLSCGASSPAWSPDGTRLAFSSCASGVFEVWIADPDGGNRRQVTNLAGRSVQATTFWPDDSSLIVSAVPPGEDQPGNRALPELFQVDLRSTAVVRLTQTPDLSERFPRADLTRNRLYFIRSVPSAPGSIEGAEARAVFFVQSGQSPSEAEQLTSTDQPNFVGFAPDASDPEPSPDGQWLAFTLLTPELPAPGTRLGDRRIGVRSQIHLIRLADRLVIKVTDFGSASQPTWRAN